MSEKKITTEEIEDILKKHGLQFPEYDSTGNVKLNAGDFVVVMNAKVFNEAVTKLIKKG